MKFKCKKGCYECCGPVPFPIETLELHEAKVQIEIKELLKNSEGLFIPLTTDGMCPFLHRKQFNCLIYNDRPIICKNFGLSENNPCAYIKPNGNPRGLAKQKQIKRKLKQTLERLKKE